MRKIIQFFSKQIDIQVSEQNFQLLKSHVFFFTIKKYFFLFNTKSNILRRFDK